MEMTLRWYGSKFDTVTLKQIARFAFVCTFYLLLYMIRSQVKFGAAKEFVQ